MRTLSPTLMFWLWMLSSLGSLGTSSAAFAADRHALDGELVGPCGFESEGELVEGPLAALGAPPPAQLTSARIDPLVVRQGVDAFEMTVTTSSPQVAEVRIDAGSLFSVGGVPTSEITLSDDGRGADDIAGDGVFTAGGIEFISARSLVGGTLLRRRGIEYIFRDASTFSAEEDLGLTFRYLNPSLPIPRARQLAPDLRATSHVVGVEQPLQGEFPAHEVDARAAAERYYGYFADDRDWLMFAYPFNTVSAAARFSFSRNNVQGIGRPLWGSGRLRGMIFLNYLSAIDHVIVNHEVLHQFAAHVDTGLDLADATGHWGVVARPSSGFGAGSFDEIDRLSDGTYRALSFGGARVAYSDLELYLMGLADIDEVDSPIQTLVNPELQKVEPTFCDPRGCAFPFVYRADALRSVTTAEILIEEGGRVPSPVDAPKSFRAAMIVVYDRPLTDVELGFYHYAASEYAKRSSAIGVSFEEATGGRASMTMAIPEPGSHVLLTAGVLWLLQLARARRKRAGSHA